MLGFYYINNGKNLYNFDILRIFFENFKPIFVPLLKRQKTIKFWFFWAGSQFYLV